MDTGNQSFLKQLGALWSRVNSGQQLFVLAAGLILIVAFGIWLGVARKPAYALLYGELSPADAGRIVGELQSKNVPYKVVDGGKAVQVPADKVDELRINLASGGFTPSGPAGYELLDKSQLGMSEYLQRTNRTRALEGELARTLMALDEVSAARVHLTLPEPTPFIAEQSEPAASVVLQLKPPGMTLSRERIAAVRTFVAGAIDAKNPDSVTIIDQNMNLLTGPTMSQPGALQPSQEEARRNYELQRAADIRSLLERAYGLGKVAVSFSCVMDFDQVQTESLKYEPVSGTNTGVLRSSEQTESSSKGTAPTGGVPGTESNIPSYPATSNQPTETKSSSETKNFEISQTHENRTQAPGTLKSQSVSVLIDSTDRDILPNDKTEAEGLVTAAAGINPAQGDTVNIAFRPFDTSIKNELEAGKALQAGPKWNMFLNWGVAAIVLIVFFVALRSFMKPMEGAFAVPGSVIEEPELPSVELPSADPEVLDKLRQRDEIRRLIKEDPAAAAKVIKTWLQE